jgi:hypothetical protein
MWKASHMSAYPAFKKTRSSGGAKPWQVKSWVIREASAERFAAAACLPYGSVALGI